MAWISAPTQHLSVRSRALAGARGFLLWSLAPSLADITSWWCQTLWYLCLWRGLYVTGCIWIHANSSTPGNCKILVSTEGRKLYHPTHIQQASVEFGFNDCKLMKIVKEYVWNLLSFRIYLYIEVSLSAFRWTLTVYYAYIKMMALWCNSSECLVHSSTSRQTIFASIYACSAVLRPVAHWEDADPALELFSIDFSAHMEALACGLTVLLLSLCLRRLPSAKHSTKALMNVLS